VLPTAPGEGDAPADKVVVNVLRDGTFRVAGASCSAGQLDELLARESRARSSPPLVRIRCQAEVPYRYVQDVMDSCSRVGIPRVSFVEYPAIADEEG
jgi:biopolymer transport protein ExbD